MPRNRLSAFIFLNLLVPSLLLGQQKKFHRVQDENGRPYGVVNSIIQDRAGFLWFGSSEGLYRYDGQHFKTLHHEINETASLSNDYVVSLAEDSQGMLWISTTHGLNRYDPFQEQMTRFIMDDDSLGEGNNYILSLLVDSKDNVWWGTSNGLFRRDAETEEVIHFHPKTPEAYVPVSTIFGLYEDSRNRIWLGTSDGLVIMDPDSLELLRWYDQDYYNAFCSGGIWAFNLQEEEDGSMMVGTSTYGLINVKEQGDSLVFQRYHMESEPALSENYINHTARMSDGSIWIGTWNGGLNIYSEKGGKAAVEQVLFNPQRRDGGLPSNQVVCSYEDRSGVTWVSTKSGLVRVLPGHKEFQVVDHLNSNLDDPNVQSVLRDRQGYLWVGTRSGLGVLDPVSFREQDFHFELVEEDGAQGLLNDNIYDIEQDLQGRIWLATYRGVFYSQVDPGTRPFFKRYGEGDALPHSFVHSILTASDGHLWICTYGGLSRIEIDSQNPNSSPIIDFGMDPRDSLSLNNSCTYDCTEDRFGNPWVGTFNGLSKHLSDEEGGRFENHIYEHRPEDLPNSNVPCLKLSEDGELWIGTRSGLSRLNQDSKGNTLSFTNYGHESGFESVVINSIEEDDQGRFWVGTTSGLYLFDPAQTVIEGQEVLDVYRKNDGLSGNVCNPRSSFRDKDGFMFFGTSSGLSYFQPSAIGADSLVPQVVITQLSVLNEVQVPSSEPASILQESISYVRSIILSAEQHTFRLSFAALNYVDPSANRYRYRLRGFDERWLDSGTRSEVSYTNLAPGHYTFELMGSNSDGVWNQEPRRLDIEIRPPWYASRMAYVVYVLVIGLISYAVFRIRLDSKLRKIRQELEFEKVRQDERERIHERTASDFHDELGHRITKILMYSNLVQLDGQDPSKTKSYADILNSNARKLSQGVRDFIWAIDAKKGKVIHLVDRLDEFIQEISVDTDIAVRSSCSDRKRCADIELTADARRQLIFIFKEGVNNAVKHSECKNLHMNYSLKEDQLEIQLTDDGKGFDPHAQPSNYGLKSIQNRCDKMGFDLELDSKKGEGTVLKVVHKLEITHMG